MVDVNSQLRELYKSANFRAFADWAAEFKRNPAETNVDRATISIGLSRNDVSMVLRKLCDLKLGTWVIGRHGAKTRVIWEYTISEIGRAMRGDEPLVTDEDEGLTLRNPNYVDEQAADALSSSSVGETVNSAMHYARHLLSLACGVPPERIEISIKY